MRIAVMGAGDVGGGLGRAAIVAREMASPDITLDASHGRAWQTASLLVGPTG
jgi:predicted dinucleotide-binding enzyme